MAFEKVISVRGKKSDGMFLTIPKSGAAYLNSVACDKLGVKENATVSVFFNAEENSLGFALDPNGTHTIARSVKSGGYFSAKGIATALNLETPQQIKLEYVNSESLTGLCGTVKLIPLMV